MADHDHRPQNIARQVPAWLVSDAVLAPWTTQLTDHETAEVASIATVLRKLTGRLTVLASRLPADDEALLAALLARTWADGVAATATRLLDLVQHTAEQTADTTTRTAAATLQARYAQDPVRARRDGLDLLAGSLLTSEGHDPDG